MARAMQNFRGFVRSVLDGIIDETGDAVRQAARATRKGTAYHAEVWAALGLQGEVTEDSAGAYDVRVTATVPIAAGPIGGAAITPSGGTASSTSGQFLGPGQVNVGVRVVIVNAQAMEAGTSVPDPGNTENQ